MSISPEREQEIRDAHSECRECEVPELLKELDTLRQERDSLKAEVHSACQALQDEQCLTERLERQVTIAVEALEYTRDYALHSREGQIAEKALSEIEAAKGVSGER